MTTESLPGGPQLKDWSVRDTDKLRLELQAELEAAGVFTYRRWPYFGRAAWVLTTVTCCWAVVAHDPGWLISVPLIALTAIAVCVGGGMMHDAGHGAMTPNHTLAEAVGQVFMTLVAGSSFRQWQSFHHDHHREVYGVDDPDLDFPVVALRSEDAATMTGLRRQLVKYQHLFCVPASTLGSYWLKGDTLRAIVQRPRELWLDALLMVGHVGLWIALPASLLGWKAALLNYALLTWFKGVHLAFIFIPNHVGCSTSPDLDVFRRQVEGTRNVGASWLTTQLYSGLNHHVEHHLFPKLSYFQLGKARPIVRAFCRRRGINYHETSALGSIVEMVHFNREMAEHARGSEWVAMPGRV